MGDSITTDRRASRNTPSREAIPESKPATSTTREEYMPQFATSHADSNKMVFYGDHQLHHTVRRTSIQSRIYDQLIEVSIRPQAVVLAAPLFQREAMKLIRNKYTDHYQYNMGDVLDISNLREWVLYLDAEEEDLSLQAIEARLTNPDAPKADDLYGGFLDAYDSAPDILPPIVEGNHDGAYVGNGLNHRVRTNKLKERINTLGREIAAIDRKLKRLKKDTAPHVTPNLRIANLKRIRARYIQEIEEIKNILKDFIKNLEELDLDPKLIPPRILTWLINSLLGVPGGSPLFSSMGSASQNAGGQKYIVDKKKFIRLYLASRFKNIAFDRDTLEPFVTKIEYFSENTGYYRTQDSILSNLNYTLPKNARENFNNFWKEARPGEYLCLVEVPCREKASANQRYIMLQAFDQGLDASGKHIYTFMLDGMDMTGENVPIAFFGGLSEWQRRFCQLFIDTMRLRNGKDGNLFYHLSHFPLKDYSKGKWKKFGWDEYFKQPDVVPYVFAAHRHHRAVLDESKPTNISLDLPIFGATSIKKKRAASIVSPSLTDNLEFMTSRTQYDPKSGQHTVKVDYHKIFSEDPDNEHYKEFDDDVVAEVDRLREHYVSRAYRKFSEMKSDIFTSLHHLLSTDHSAVIAFDAIPIMIAQFNETIIYTQSYLRFLTEDFGNENPFVKKTRKTLEGLLRHRERWLYGNPNAPDDLHKIGYLAARKHCEKMPRHEVIETLTEFNDLFDTPLYDMLRLLITDTPFTADSHKAYDFWLLLGKRAQEEEMIPITPGQRHKQRKFALPDSQLLTF